MTSEYWQGYEFRRVGPDDAPDLTRLRCAQITDIERFHTLGESYTPISLEEAQQQVSPETRAANRAYFDEMLAAGRFVGWLVYDRTNGQPVGTAGYVVHHAPPNGIDPNGLRGQVHNVYILGNYRRSGLAREIMRRLIADAYAANLARLELHSSDEGMYLYRSLGFEEKRYMQLKFPYSEGSQAKTEHEAP